MRVIKKGRKQAGWSKEVECTGAGNAGGGCGARLLVEQPDLYKTARHYYDGSSDEYTTFTCSECGVETDIKVPSQVESGLPSKADWQKASRARPGTEAGK